jgi:hypothetical protein
MATDVIRIIWHIIAPTWLRVSKQLHLCLSFAAGWKKQRVERLPQVPWPALRFWPSCMMQASCTPDSKLKDGRTVRGVDDATDM